MRFVWCISRSVSVFFFIGKNPPFIVCLTSRHMERTLTRYNTYKVFRRAFLTHGTRGHTHVLYLSQFFRGSILSPSFQLFRIGWTHQWRTIALDWSPDTYLYGRLDFRRGSVSRFRRGALLRLPRDMQFTIILVVIKTIRMGREVSVYYRQLFIRDRYIVFSTTQVSATFERERSDGNYDCYLCAFVRPGK